jgi:radical SAM superfamily enzyme YgiQ (UPF0313 family)
VHYVEPLFRPPSEADSLLLPTTVGCSNNRCTFCAMYMTKKFRVLDLADTFADLEEARGARHYRRAFLLDGDALAAPQEHLEAVLGRVRERLPWIERVSTYGDARSILAKGADGLRRLGELGLGLVYHGIESGNPTVLERIRKPVSFDEMAEVGRIMKASGVGYSVMALLGLGGTELTAEHARDTATALSKLDPDYIGLLTLMLVPGTAMFRSQERGELVLPDRFGMLAELRTILAGVQVTKARFSANHASNYLPLRGDLPADRERLLALVDDILSKRDDRRLKPEWSRGL